MAEWLKKTHRQLFDDGSGAITLHRKNIHEYLGMNIDYQVRGEVKISMIPYVKKIIYLFAKHDNNKSIVAVTPATEHPFKLGTYAAPLKQMFSVLHNLVSKFLFATKRARPEIYTEGDLSP